VNRLKDVTTRVIDKKNDSSIERELWGKSLSSPIDLPDRLAQPPSIMAQHIDQQVLRLTYFVMGLSN
jgi:hypothetical protein